jgi:cysteinyl-tRNA synthetase
MPKSKVSALLSLLLVFSSGALVGAVAHRLYMVKTVSGTASVTIPQPPRKMDPEDARRRILADYRDKVKLDDQQIQQVDQIYDQTREQFEDVRKKLNSEGQAIWKRQTEEVKAILRPDQVPLFEAYRAEREAEREAERKRHRGPGGGGPGGPPPNHR